MDSQVTRSRQRILESAAVLLREGNLPGQLVEAAAEAARVPLPNAKLFFQNDEELILAFYLRLANDLEVRASALPPKAGAAVMLVTPASLYWVRGVPALRSVALLSAAAACLWLTNAIRRLSREVAAAPLEIGIARVKSVAKKVPAWVTVVAWTSFAAVAVLLLYSSKLF